MNCSNSECKVIETNRCIEGLALDKCPKFQKDGISTQADSPPKDTTQQVTHDILIASGKRLNMTDATLLLCERRCKVIAFVGPNESGKTSLIASLFDVFQRSCIADYSFASSRTLHSFEELLHLSRLLSGEKQPTMLHTSLRQGLGFFHLGISSPQQDGTIDFVLIDRPGEEHRALLNRVDASKTCAELQRAEVVGLMVDGLRMLDSGARHNAIAEVKLLAKALVESHLVTQTQKLALILTKQDTIAASSQKLQDRVAKDFENLANVLRLETLSNFDFQCFRVAALPSFDSVPQGFGFESLLAYCIKDVEKKEPPVEPAPLSHRAFAKLGVYQNE